MTHQIQSTQICQRGGLWTLGPLAILCLTIFAVPARADIVRFANGRSISVDSARFDGDTVILTMANGGELRTSRDMVAELLPDELPMARTVGIEALATSRSAAAPLPKNVILALVSRVAAKLGLDDKLAHAVVKIESNYNQRALSSKGAMGLMQIMPALAAKYDLGDPFDPEKNLEAGMRHLQGLLGRFDRRRALAAYNAGEGAVALYGGVPPYRETESYVRRIMAALR